MSAPTAEPARAAGAGTVIGIAIVLMLVAALVALLVAFRGGPIDGLAQLKAASGVPWMGGEYAVVDARAMPAGARVIRFEDAAAPAEPEKIDVPSPAKADDPKKPAVSEMPPAD